MDIKKIEHIGIAVKDLQTSIRFYEEVFGLKCYKIEKIEDQYVNTAFFMIGDTKLELLESTTPDGPIAKHLEKRGEGMHHIAFEVDDISSALREAESQGIQLIDRVSRKGAEGFNIAFLHPKSTQGVLTELCEKPKA
jgi:methylmalonyl-CoA/ethylmalonyl-CoA epimerase